MSTSNLGIRTIIDGAAYSLEQPSAEYDLVSVIPDVSIAGAKSGSLTTRTDNDTGTLTMDTGHGITTGQLLDVYWTTDDVQYCRRGMTVGSVSGNSVPIDGGAGTNLPVATTSVVAMVPTSQTLTLDTADFIVWGARTNTTKAVTISFGTTTDGAYVEGAAVTLNGSDGTWGKQLVSASTYLAANPVAAAGAFNTVLISHGDTSAATVGVHIGTT